MYKNVADAMKAVDLAVEDTLKDQPEFKNQEHTIYHDMVQSIMYDCDRKTARELGRRTGVAVVGGE